MKTTEILENIRGNGGFDNFRNWTKKEIAQWVRSSFNCSYYVSMQVASYLI